MQELPRFTGSLRALSSEAPFDVEEARVKRRKRLEQMKKNRTLQSLMTDSRVALTWASFVAPLKGAEGRTAEEDRQMRKQYNAFTAALSQCLGEEVPPSHMQQVAHTVFHVLAAEQEDSLANASYASTSCRACRARGATGS